MSQAGLIGLAVAGSAALLLLLQQAGGDETVEMEVAALPARRAERAMEIVVQSAPAQQVGRGVVLVPLHVHDVDSGTWAAALL